VSYRSIDHVIDEVKTVRIDTERSISHQDDLLPLIVDGLRNFVRDDREKLSINWECNSQPLIGCTASTRMKKPDAILSKLDRIVSIGFSAR
jgi:hypothetical protein